MISEQRTCRRFNVYVVGEFKSTREGSRPFLGITRNISSGGISFESQKYSLEPGDSIDFTLKDPDHDLVVSSSGKIIWKRNSSKFDSVSGIRFKETDSSIESRMLDIISKSGIAPVKRDYPEADTGSGQAEEKENPDVPQLITHDPSTAVSGSPGEGRGEADASRAQNAPVDEYNQEDQHERALPWWRKVWFYASLLFLCVVLLVIALPGRFDTQPPDPESSRASSDRKESVIQRSDRKPSALSGPAEERPVPVIIKPDSGQDETLQQKKVDLQGTAAGADAEPVPPVRREQAGKEYYVQVGSWKNPQYARRTLSEIKRYYPETVIVTEGGFYRIIIPGVHSLQQGELIVKDIKKKIDLQALLVLRKK